jgi:hypothetical protein
MALADDISRVAAAAGGLAEDAEALTGVVASEPREGWRVYLCCYERAGGGRSWLALDGSGAPLDDRQAVREAVSIAALCELAEETAAGGDVEQLLGRLAELRGQQTSLDIGRAEAAARALAAVTEQPPRLASPAYLDRVGDAANELERALGGSTGSPFALTLQQGMPAIEALVEDVQRSYKRPLS